MSALSGSWRRTSPGAGVQVGQVVGRVGELRAESVMPAVLRGRAGGSAVHGVPVSLLQCQLQLRSPSSVVVVTRLLANWGPLAVGVEVVADEVVPQPVLAQAEVNSGDSARSAQADRRSVH